MPRRAALLLLCALASLTPRVDATWSIVLTDCSTGEVAVATATCLPNENLKRYVPVIVVGKGAGAAQSQVDPTAKNKKQIVAGLLAGTDPQVIIQQMNAADQLLKCSRQYGIVDLAKRKWAYSGGCNGPWKGHVRGQIGNVTYSIQGNVLTGEAVILAAEQAVLATEGKLSDRLLAGMIAAGEMGGDGRCSCLTGSPPSCGAPPVDGFEKSAHVGSFIVARIGDTDGLCNGALGCATGDYWLELNQFGGVEDADPVVQLIGQYAQFEQRMRGLPDAITSEVLVSPPVALAGGQTAVDIEVSLRDLNGLPVPFGGAEFDVSHAEGSAGVFQRHRVIDHGDGTYSVRVVAPAPPPGVEPELDLVQLRVIDQHIDVVLYPFAEVGYALP
jgi:hypothetical protein